MNAYAVVYRNEGRTESIERLSELVKCWEDDPDSDERYIAAAQAAIAALSQPYTLHTLCKTPECAVESIHFVEGAEVFGMATIAVESESVSGMRFRVREKSLAEVAAGGITDHQRRMRGTNPGSNE